jgi:hypothetical protein
MKKYSPYIHFIICLLFCTCCNTLRAQVVNIEDRRMQVPDSVHFMGFADLGGYFFKNDKSLLSIKGNLQLEYYKDRHFVISLTNFNLINSDEQNFLNDGFQHIRYNYVANKWITLEAFGQLQYNERTRLLLRGLTGAGPRLRLKPIFKQRVHLGIIPMYEYNQIRDTILIHRDIRLSNYLSIHVRLFQNKVSVSSTTYFQPLINDWSNFRVSSETSILFQILKRWNFRTSFTYAYDNDRRIPENIPDQVYSFNNGLRWDF